MLPNLSIHHIVNETLAKAFIKKLVHGGSVPKLENGACSCGVQKVIVLI